MSSDDDEAAFVDALKVLPTVDSKGIISGILYCI